MVGIRAANLGSVKAASCGRVVVLFLVVGFLFRTVAVAALWRWFFRTLDVRMEDYFKSEVPLLIFSCCCLVLSCLLLKSILSIYFVDFASWLKNGHRIDSLSDFLQLLVKKRLFMAYGI